MYTIYGKESCPFCTQAKILLQMKEQEYTYIDVTQDEEAQKLFVQNNWKKVPQIFKDDEHIGGFTDLKATFK